MSNEDPWKTLKPNELGGSTTKETLEPRYCDAKEAEQRSVYEAYYQYISPILTDGELDFKQVAQETGLKERKIREILLFRLASDDLIGLFGHKEGICYVCASRMRSNLTHEPLCIPCIEAIGKAIMALFPMPEEETPPSAPPTPSPGVSQTEPSPPISALPAEPIDADHTTDMVPKTQFDAAMQELQRYRNLYGPLSADVAPDLDHITAGAEENPEAAPTVLSDMDHINKTLQDILESVDNDEEIEGINYITLSLNELPKGSESNESIRHFGFQRLKAGS